MTLPTLSCADKAAGHFMRNGRPLFCRDQTLRSRASDAFQRRTTMPNMA